MSLEKTIPRVNWPEKDGEHNVVQLDIDGQPYLRFPQKECEDYGHAETLRVALEKQGIKPELMPNRLGKMIPVLKGERYEVYGMGIAKIDVGQRRAFFSGRSWDYDISINREHLDSISQLEPDWNIDPSD